MPHLTRHVGRRLAAESAAPSLLNKLSRPWRNASSTASLMHLTAMLSLQTVYRDPTQDVAVRLGAARTAARFERSQLRVVMAKDVTAPTDPAALDQRIADCYGRARRCRCRKLRSARRWPD
jgi:hypothetical protein